MVFFPLGDGPEVDLVPKTAVPVVVCYRFCPKALLRTLRRHFRPAQLRCKRYESYSWFLLQDSKIPGKNTSLSFSSLIYYSMSKRPKKYRQCRGISEAKIPKTTCNWRKALNVRSAERLGEDDLEVTVMEGYWP